MKATSNTSNEGAYCGRAVRGLSNLSHEDLQQIEAHRAKDRPTPWAHLAARYGVNEIDLRGLFHPGEKPPAPPRQAPVRRSRSEREQRFIALWTGGTPKHEIAYQTGMSNGTIDRMRLDLGLPKRAEGAKPNGWTEEEDAFIRLHYVILGETAESVAKALGRTRNAIIGRTHRNGWTRQTLRGLAA